MLFRIAAIVVIFTIVSSAGLATAECSSSDVQQISVVRDAWVTDWNAQHVGEVMKLYATDASYLTADGNRLSKPDDIRSYFDALSGSKVSVQSVTLGCSGDIAADSGTYTQDFAGGGATISNGATMSNGATISGGKGKHVEGQYLVVLKRVSGGGGMGGKAGMGGNAGMGGGGSRWVIEQHASTMKP